MEQDNGYKVEYIPPNFREGVSVMGYMIKIGNIIQAAPIIAAEIILILIIAARASFLTKFIIIIIAAAPVLAVAVVGINGDSIFGFIKHLTRARKERATYIYNPRVKSEIKPVSDDPDSVEMLPRERILGYIEKVKNEKDSSEDYTTMPEGELFFEDDEGFVDKPYEYMTRKERKNIKKNRK